MSSFSIEDTQGKDDLRGVAIRHVGISSLTWPGEFFDGKAWQAVVFHWKLGVALPASQRGTHMSRFVQWVRDEATKIDPAKLPALAESLRKRLNASACRIECRVELFRQLSAPHSGEQGLVSSQLTFVQEAVETQSSTDVETSLRRNLGGGKLVQSIATLCPCSKAISARGAHNQRGEIRVFWTAEKNLPITFEEFAALIDSCASAPLYPILKREDEKIVTEQAYDHPAFVEDVVREVTLQLRKLDLLGFRVEVENFESIHQHNAWAVVEEGELLKE